MAEATLTSKGQVTLPKEMRDEMGVKAGDKLTFVQRPDGRWLVYAKNKSIRDLKGMFGKPKRTVTLEEMDQAIAEGAARRAGLKKK